jgi:SAM-dependent methyltransferase
MKDRFFGVSPDEFLLHHCSSCGLLFQQESEISDRLASFYPAGYWWQASGGLSFFERTYREWVVRRDQLAFLTSLFPDSQGERLLDIGCGGGTFVKLAQQEGFDAYGLEQSQEGAGIADQQAPGRIFHGLEQDLISRSEKFDILTLFHSLEHMTDPFRYLKIIRKLLREPGKLIVQVPNVHSLQARILRSRWYGLDCPRHVYNYSAFSLLHLLGRAGYRIQRVRHFSLRDNAAALVSSLFPVLDPMSQRVKLFREKGRLNSPSLSIRESIYFALFVLAQPFALLEASLGRGGTVTVYATMD